MLDGREGGRERETSINDKGAAHHGNRHTKKVTQHCGGGAGGGGKGGGGRGGLKENVKF